MQKPTTIIFRHMDSSEAVEEIIRKRVSKLENFYSHIIHCTVSIEAPRNHARHGFPFEVRIEVTVPGKNIVVKSKSEMHHANVDAYAAIRRTFDAAERRVEDYARVQRHDVKRHTRDSGAPSHDSGLDSPTD